VYEPVTSAASCVDIRSLLESLIIRCTSTMIVWPFLAHPIGMSLYPPFLDSALDGFEFGRRNTIRAAFGVISSAASGHCVGSSKWRWDGQVRPPGPQNNPSSSRDLVVLRSYSLAGIYCSLRCFCWFVWYSHQTAFGLALSSSLSWNPPTVTVCSWSSLTVLNDLPNAHSGSR
jgi:hypothetical protein